MIKKAIVFSFLICLCACTASAGSFSDPAVPIEVASGNRFTIELPSNATTGYSWDFGTPIDENIIRLVNTEYKNPDSFLVGAGGTQVWIFEAVAPGATSIVLEYSRSWETVPPIQTANFAIIVK